MGTERSGGDAARIMRDMQLGPSQRSSQVSGEEPKAAKLYCGSESAGEDTGWDCQAQRLRKRFTNKLERCRLFDREFRWRGPLKGGAPEQLNKTVASCTTTRSAPLTTCSARLSRVI